VQRQEEDEELQMKPLVQRQGEEEEMLQAKPFAQRQEEEEELQTKPLVQRQEEDEELQMKPLVQRQGEEEEMLQAKPFAQRQQEEEELQTKPLVQRQEEDEELQMKPMVQRQGEEEEMLQAKPFAQRQQEDEELQTKPLVQRQEEDEELQMKPLVQRQGEEEEMLQAKPLAQRQGEEEEMLQAKPFAQRQQEDEELQMKPMAQRQEEDEGLQMKPLVQRQGEEEEMLQAKPLARRQGKEEEMLQAKPLAQRQVGLEGGDVEPGIEQSIQQSQGKGHALADSLRTSMEGAFGADFSGVRVHDDTEAAALNDSMQARAFTTGQDIYLRQGEYNPGNSTGQELLAHELTHVVQQSGAGVMSHRAMQPQAQRQEEEEELQMKPMAQRQEDVVSGQAQSPEELAVFEAMKEGPLLEQAREKEELPHGKIESVQRQDLEDEELLQGKFANSQAPTQLRGIDGLQENSTWIPDNLKAGNENLSGVSLDNVNVHYNSAETAQRDFNPATASNNAHLRAEGVWGTYIGPKISNSSHILVDDSKSKLQVRSVRSNVTWKPAVNATWDQVGAVPDDKKGFIRSTRYQMDGETLKVKYENDISTILTEAEKLHPSLAGKLVKDQHIAFLLKKALGFNEWGTKDTNEFVNGLSSASTKLARIRDGATFVANSLEYWRKWLHPEKKAEVVIDDVEFIESDLHEHGLGVIKVKFTKPLGPKGHKFAGDEKIGVMIKPEDKSLEENLLGDKKGSLANQINRIVGLVDPKEMLTTIKMKSTKKYGSLVELVKGASAEVIVEKKLDRPMEKAFHETLVFAFLTGMDDLHKENVFWHEGRPYLIDADNVLISNQMKMWGPGAFSQGGFGDYNKKEADKNKEAIKSGNNTVKSKLLDAMLNKPLKRDKILKAIKKAITGKQGRVVPIRTRFWKGQVDYWARYKNPKNLDLFSSEVFMVREGKGFESTMGPGLAGVVAKNEDNPFFDSAAERKQIKADFEAGVIPFYEYDYDKGFVTHNKTKIYHGQTLEQGIQYMLDKFTPKIQ